MTTPAWSLFERDHHLQIAALGTNPDTVYFSCRCWISRVHGFPSFGCATSQSALAAPAAAAERLGSAGTACTAGSAHEPVPAEPRGHGTVSPPTAAAAAAATDDAEHASTPAECPCSRMEATLGLRQHSCWLHFKQLAVCRHCPSSHCTQAWLTGRLPWFLLL